MSNNVFEKVNIDFHILDVLDPNYFLVVDNSEWGGIIYKPSIIEVTTPEFETPVTHNYLKNGTNQFNSLSLGLVCDSCKELTEIPDGVYTVTVKGSPDKYQKTKNYLRTVKLQLELDELLIKNVSSCSEVSDSLVKKINKIDKLVRAAKANLRYGNTCEASAMFLEASKQVEKMKKCKSLKGDKKGSEKKSGCSSCGE